MRSYITASILIILILSCDKRGDDENSSDNNDIESTDGLVTCDNAVYGNWEVSDYVLPYPVGTSYKVDLNQCSGSFHAPGEPDQFAVDFDMQLGSEITASRDGVVVHIEESGRDFGFPNNLIVIKNGDTYDQYMHLTENGSVVNVGDTITKGQLIGYSGATGFAGYPHLHFVVSKNSWEYPYNSIPYNFSNTQSNPRGPESGVVYAAEDY